VDQELRTLRDLTRLIDFLFDFLFMVDANFRYFQLVIF